MALIQAVSNGKKQFIHKQVSNASVIKEKAGNHSLL
jgi:hypothetical protein